MTATASYPAKRASTGRVFYACIHVIVAAMRDWTQELCACFIPTSYLDGSACRLSMQ